MKFINAWLDGFRRYVQFDGRASRLGFWSFFLGNYIFVWLLNLLAWQVQSLSFLSYIAAIWGLIALVPLIAVSVRRLHDHHFSGLWLLIALTFIGIFVLLIGFALPGDPGPNRYGAQPGHRANTDDNSGAA